MESKVPDTCMESDITVWRVRYYVLVWRVSGSRRCPVPRPSRSCLTCDWAMTVTSSCDPPPSACVLTTSACLSLASSA